MFKSVTPQVDFPTLEKEILAKWEKTGLVDKYLHRNDSSKEKFSFLDGPITANNPMGVHHAWGRTYKDLWQRFWNMRGKRQRFQNGFDCQGLWVEVEVEKELGIRNKKDIENLVPNNKKASIAKFVDLCKQRVLKYSKIQSKQSQRLAEFMDWDNSYYTMSDENNYMIWHFLKTCNERGWIYKGRDSVPWCPRCETAISEHEILTENYKEVMHKAIYFALPILDRKNEFLLVWTTTPWTLPANIAVAVDKNLDYVLVNGDKGRKYWLAKGREGLVSDPAIIEKEVKGSKLIGLKYRGMFDGLSKVKKVAEENPDKFHTVIATDPFIMPITTTEGTGLVHTAVSAGSEDFKLGKKLGLPMIPVIEDNADYMNDLDFLSGKNAKKHPEVILDYLEAETNKGEPWVFKIENYTHRYPSCWRCKTELVWKVTYEWYIAMDKPEAQASKTLREQMVDTAKMIDWHPSFGLERELDWLINMHDWLISKKNRYWGLALPIYECQACGSFEVIGGKEELKKRAVSGFKEFENKSPHKPFIDEVKIKCSKCGEIISRIDDVGNVWLDAGSVPFSTYIDPKTKELSYIMDKKYWDEWFPADFITESFPGQFKNWFYSMIAMSTVLEKKNPFKTVLGFASMLGEDGRPMHKSWGNAIEFNEGADKIGVDVMRWMFAIQDPENNLLFGYKKADETRRKFHLILWNIYNFFVTYAQVDEWKPTKMANGKQQIADRNLLDKWIISRYNNMLKNVTQNLEKYDAQKSSLEIENFVNDLSLWFVRRSRDRIGPSSENETDKNDCYETLYFVLVNLSKIIAPFIPFISEEIYINLTGNDSVHLDNWPEVNEKLINVQLEDEMIKARLVVESAHALRKQAEVKVRIPIRQMSYSGPGELSPDVIEIIKAEINAYNLDFGSKADQYSVIAKTSDDNLDLNFGLARDIVRKIQEERKNLGTKPNEKVNITIPFWPKEHEDYIKKKALISKIIEGEKFQVLRDE
jgi:isoleucyl-tRNA synthetase